MAHVYDRLPRDFRVALSPVVEPSAIFVKRILTIVSQIRLPVYFLQGREKGSGHPLSVLFWGEEHGALYVSSLLFSEEPVQKNLKKVYIWALPSALHSSLPKADLLFARVDGVYSRWLARRGLMILPEWVLFMLPLNKPLPEMWKLSKNKSLRENLGEIKKNQYTYEITCDPEKFEFFYHRMYLPYITKRYGKISLPHSVSFVKRNFERGQLLLVKRGEERVSGCIIRAEPQVTFLIHVGVREGKLDELKRGALSATYYYSILWAKERGCQWYDAGHCRPFFKDGVFFHKRKWGMEVKKSKRVQTVLGLGIGSFHPGVFSFLANNPFVFIARGKLKGLIFSEKTHALTLEEVQSILKSYSIPGLENLVLLAPNGFTPQAKAFAASQTTSKLELIPMGLETFFKTFPNDPSGLSLSPPDQPQEG